MVTAALVFACLMPVVVTSLLVIALALGHASSDADRKEAERWHDCGDRGMTFPRLKRKTVVFEDLSRDRAGLSEGDVSLAQHKALRDRPGVLVMAGACGLAGDFAKRGRAEKAAARSTTHGGA
jgi:hypothetical protein